MKLGPTLTVRAIAGAGSLAPTWVRFGPSVLPFSPNLWHAVHPDDAASS